MPAVGILGSISPIVRLITGSIGRAEAVVAGPTPAGAHCGISAVAGAHESFSALSSSSPDTIRHMA
jgi:hypothetical protein